MDTPRIIGDRQDAVTLRHNDDTCDHMTALACARVVRAELAAERQRVLARHAELVATETHPVLAKLLGEHAPIAINGQLICRKCPVETDPFGDDELVQAPCPTWKTIEAGA